MMKAKRCFLGRLTCSVLVAGAIGFHATESQADEPEENTGVSLTYDLSASAGSSGGLSYTEIALGLNTHISSWFVWRNAGFTRMGTGYEGTYGLDTSARFQFDVGDQTLGLHAFGGPGYRFVSSPGQASSSGSRVDSAPFVEAGGILNLGGLRVGAGIKTVFTQAVDSNRSNETQYFLILSGGGRL